MMQIQPTLSASPAKSLNHNTSVKCLSQQTAKRTFTNFESSN